MANPHNPKRYGETWNTEKIELCKKELELLKENIILSGGWAWHFMSPKDHIEYKHAHDHKDIDIFVEPKNVVLVNNLLFGQGFKKVQTRFDKHPSNRDSFRRYEKEPKIIIDFFVRSIPYIKIDGWKIVEPKTLLSLYSNIHSSKNCFAVVAAKKLFDNGIYPVGREELLDNIC